MTALEKLRELNGRGKIRKDSRGLHLGKVVDLEDEDMDIRDFYLSDSERGGHLGCFGTTGIGKTRGISHMISQDIQAGSNVVIIDPKGDISLLSTAIYVAALAGRLDEFMFISPIVPDYSIKIDPLAYYYITDEVVDHVVSGIRAREDYFVNVASEVTDAIVNALIALAGAKGVKPFINFWEIKSRCSYGDLKNLLESIINLRSHPNLEIRELVRDVSMNIEQILQSPPDFFSKVSSSLRTVLTALTSSTTGKIIGKAKTNEFVRRFEAGEGVILVCHTGSLLARRTAHIIGRVLTSMIQSTVGRFFTSGRKLSRPLAIYVDEGHNVLYKGVEELFNKGRGVGVCMHFFTQSIAQMTDAIGEETTQSIIDNISTWLYMRVNHDATAKYIEESTPLKKKYDRILSMAGGGLGVNIKEGEERLVLKERVVRLRPRYYYLRASGRLYKGKFPEISDPLVKVQFPETLSCNSGPIGEEMGIEEVESGVS